LRHAHYVNVDELRHALGGVVLEAAYLERILRAAFSALVGSKYAAVVDGRLTAAALIEDCEQITRYHTGVTEPAKEALLAALRACRQANKERNRVIHDTWATRPGSVMVTLHDEGRSHDVMVTARPGRAAPEGLASAGPGWRLRPGAGQKSSRSRPRGWTTAQIRDPPASADRRRSWREFFSAEKGRQAVRYVGE
jgi:hypothetical protein